MATLDTPQHTLDNLDRDKLQIDLDDLARSHHKLGSDGVADIIGKITQEDVFIVMDYAYYTTSNYLNKTLEHRSYKLKEYMKYEYPYLDKFYSWYNLFDRIEDTNCYVLGAENKEWLEKKNRDYIKKQSLCPVRGRCL